MLTLDQVKLLEAKVESLIELVKSLYAERDALRDAIKNKERLIDDLSLRVANYEAEQAKIEERVVSAINQLDSFQSTVSSARAILTEKEEGGVSTSQSYNEVQRNENAEETSPSNNNALRDKNSSADESNFHTDTQSDIQKDISNKYSEGEVKTSSEPSLQQEQKTDSSINKVEDDNSDKQMDIF